MDINLPKVPDCALCLTMAVHEQTALGVHKYSPHLSPMYKPAPAPESPRTDKWQRRVSSCFTRSTQTTHQFKWQTKSQRNELTGAVNITLLSTTAVSHFTSAACKKIWVTNDSKGLMCFTLVFVCLLHHCHPTLSCRKKLNITKILGHVQHRSKPARLSGQMNTFNTLSFKKIQKCFNDFQDVWRKYSSV